MGSKKLIVVESYGKVKTIQAMVGRDFVVKACGGHILDLNHKNLSIDISDTRFEPKYIFLKNKRKFVKDVLDMNYAYIYLATDNDREGEFIAFCLQKVLGIPLEERNRVVFNEITHEAIHRGMNHPRQINQGLVTSQQTRRMLDRIIGYKIQPYLPKTFSVGRVQSAVVKMIGDRCDSVARDPPVKEIAAEFQFDDFPGETFRADLVDDQFRDDRFIQSIVSDPESYSIKSAKTVSRTESPPKPLDTVALQRQCFYNLNMKSDETMKVSQALYEKGLITYMRTSSTALSRTFVEKMTGEIAQLFSEEFVRKGIASRSVSGPNPDPDQAHEAVRPTLESPAKVSNLEKREKRVYDLIYRHSMMACMSDAEFCDVKYEIVHPEHDMSVFGVVSDMVFSGFRAADGMDANSNADKHVAKKKGSRVVLANANIRETYRNNHALYNEASLVREMKFRGIGQASTYSHVMNHVQKKGYVAVINKPPVKLEVAVKTWSRRSGKVCQKKKTLSFFGEKNKFDILPKGAKLVEFLGDNFPRFLDIGYTSGMESDLDGVANNEKNRDDILGETLGYISGANPSKSISVSKSEGSKTKSGVSAGKKTKYIGDDSDGNKLFFGKSKYGYFIRKVYDKNVVQFFGCESGDEATDRARQITKDSYFIGVYKTKPAFVISKNDKLYIQWNKKLKSIPEAPAKIDSKLLKHLF